LQGGHAALHKSEFTASKQVKERMGSAALICQNNDLFKSLSTSEIAFGINGNHTFTYQINLRERNRNRVFRPNFGQDYLTLNRVRDAHRTPRGTQSFYFSFRHCTPHVLFLLNAKGKMSRY
jgi:hypothetical protein